jgi:hypothetical protein
LLSIDKSVVEISTRTGDFWLAPEVLLGFFSEDAAANFCSSAAVLKRNVDKAAFGDPEKLTQEDLDNLESFGVQLVGLPPLSPPKTSRRSTINTEGEEEEEDEWINEGSYFTFSYMVWGILICLDIPLSYFALILSEQPDLALFSQAICILFQCTLLAWFKPFDTPGINYYAIVAGMFQFGLAACGGFLALFTKFVNTPLGEAYTHFIPVLESLASSFTMGIMCWTLSLIGGKMAASAVEKMRKEYEQHVMSEHESTPDSDSGRRYAIKKDANAL